MAVIKQGILGGGSGKVANVTMTSWKGRAVIKGRPLSVANPRTAGQVTNRDAFSQASKFASLILASMIIPLMNRFAGDISGYNLFVKRNKQNFNEDGINIWADVNFGTGKLGDTPITNAVYADGTQDFNISWDTALDNQFKLATDKAYLLVVQKATQEIVFQGDTGVVRSAGIFNGEWDGGFNTGELYDAYLVFLRADGTQVGNTAFDESGA